MHIRLLGTGGADGIPAMYSNTRVSQHARAHGGKDIRSRTAAVIDDVLKIDFGPDTWHQLAREGLDAQDWTAVLFTHSDADHFAIDELQYALYPFNECEFAGFQIYGNAVICRAIMERYPEWPFEVVMTHNFEPFEHGGYTITPILPRHKESEEAHNFIFEADGKRFLYATDTGVYFDRTFEYLAGKRMDCVVIECTEGFVHTPYNGHLDVKDLHLVLDRLRANGTIDHGTLIVTTHHSHNGDATHNELEQALNPHGILVGFDGMTIEI
jgi:phosphoribosyl 1,2-cyclic phosphate phosphodiesterase